MTGKGSGRRPTAHDKPNAYQDNWELAFGKKKNTKQITKITANIPFEMEGDPSFEDKINYLSKLLKENYLEKLIKEDKIYFDTIFFFCPIVCFELVILVFDLKCYFFSVLLLNLYQLTFYLNFY